MNMCAFVFTLVSFVLASDQFKLLSGKFHRNSDSSSIALLNREAPLSPHLKMILLSKVDRHHHKLSLPSSFKNTISDSDLKS